MINIVQRSPLFSRLSRFDPFHNDGWFKGFWMRPFPHEMEAVLQIKIDLTENGKTYTVPGSKEGRRQGASRRELGFHQRRDQTGKRRNKGCQCYLHVSATRVRPTAFTLDREVDVSQAQAKYDNGVLELTLPKKNGSAVK